VHLDVADRFVFRPEIRGEEEASLMAVKTEGGMAVTSNPLLAERMRQCPSTAGPATRGIAMAELAAWIINVAPGPEYNLTGISAALEVHQLRRTNRAMRRCVSDCTRLRHISVYCQNQGVNLPDDRSHAWHLDSIRPNLDKLQICRGLFIDMVRKPSMSSSVAGGTPASASSTTEEYLVERQKIFPLHRLNRTD
jgi:dTDP-4-amino-4,6-dideoxygalactose transaminase